MSDARGYVWDALSSFDHVETRPGGREEVLGELSEDFPHLAIHTQHDRYHERTVPWHWHQEIEMCYVLEGPVVYATPHERVVLSSGAAGFANANVLHMTKAEGGRANVSLLVHLLRPQLLAEPGSRLWRAYVEPLARATSIELAWVGPGDQRGQELREAMLRSFETAATRAPGWELRLRDELSEIWLGFLELLGDRLSDGPGAVPSPRDEHLKAMLDYVGRHYPEHIGIAEMAAAAFTSERECYRTFRESLGVTPAQYLREYRIQQACRMLAHTTRPIAAVGEMSGLGSSSHFGRAFREAMGCTPSEYRARWQD